MTVTNGFRRVGDIGGPMELGHEYRWNVPVLTYGFDQSFLDFFGADGAAAVEGAIEIINDLPAASKIILSNYPTSSQRINFEAQSLYLVDLKSRTLALLLEQLGLAPPARNIFGLKRWSSKLLSPTPEVFPYATEDQWPSGTISNLIVESNFDPQTLAASHVMNGRQFTGFAYWVGAAINTPPAFMEALEYPVDPLANSAEAIAENPFWLVGEMMIPDNYPASLFGINPPYLTGLYCTGLTRDDVGGLRYLYNKANLNYEYLLLDVRAKMNGALRPGIEKIQLARMPSRASGRGFWPLRYEYNDTYYLNGLLRKQRAVRIVTQPDILFAASDTGERQSLTALFLRSGTAKWANNAALNSAAEAGGPGVIRPPVKIIFHKLGPVISTYESFPDSDSTLEHSWASFDNSRNHLLIYPRSVSNQNRFTLRLRFFDSTNGRQITNHTWQLTFPVGASASLQVSTNETDWNGVATANNSGGVIEWYHHGAESPRKFFRVVAVP